MADHTPAPSPDLQEWAARLCAALGLDVEVDVPLILDVARDAAHGVARPAAPLTTFLVGYAAARRGGTPDDVAAAAAVAQALAVSAGGGSVGGGDSSGGAR